MQEIKQKEQNRDRIRTLDEDLLEGGVVNHFYVSLTCPNCFYSIEGFDKLDDQVVLNTKAYDAYGGGKCLTEPLTLFECLDDPCAPEYFIPKNKKEYKEIA